MLQGFIEHVSQQHLFPTGQEVLLAVSGGIDSVVLAHLMHAAGYPFAMAHCNFHLRPGDCDRDERFVRRLAASYGVTIHVAHFDTRAYASEHRLCIEEAARDLRYGYFHQLLQSQGYAAILTAHHRDDAAETFFINLLRGTGLTGLRSILPVQGRVVRPLLPFGREDIEAYASQNALDHVEDSTNASLEYRRNQIRHQLLPMLRQLQPSADRALQQTIRNLQSADRLLQALLQPMRRQLLTVAPDGTATLSLAPQYGSPDLDRQLFYQLLRPYGFNAAAVAAILSASQSGRQFYSHTHRALLHRGTLIITPLAGDAAPLAEDFVIEVSDFSYSPDAFRRMLGSLPDGVALFDAATVSLPLTLRHWREGDRFQPLGMPSGSQLLSDYFTDHHFSLLDKQRQLILVDAAGSILWIVRRRTDHPHRVTPATTRLLTVSVLPAFSEDS